MQSFPLEQSKEGARASWRGRHCVTVRTLGVFQLANFKIKNNFRALLLSTPGVQEIALAVEPVDGPPGKKSFLSWIPFV